MHKGVALEYHRSPSQVTPVQCRRGTGCLMGIRAVGRHWRLGLRAETCRTYCREPRRRLTATVLGDMPKWIIKGPRERGQGATEDAPDIPDECK